MTAVNTNPGTPAGIAVRVFVIAVTVAALLAWAFGLGGCSHLPTQLTTAAAHGCAAMLERAASECGEPIEPACAAEVWNVSERDAASLLKAAGRIADHDDPTGGEGE